MTALRRYRVLALLLGTATFAVAWLYVWYLPRQAAIAQLGAEVTTLQEDNNRLAQLLSAANVSSETAHLLRLQKEEILSSLYSTDSIVTFVDRFEALMRRTGIQYVSTFPDLEQLLAAKRVAIGDHQIASMRFRTEAQASIFALGDALDSLRKMPYFGGIDGLRVTYNEGAAPLLLCAFDFTALFRDPEVRR